MLRAAPGALLGGGFGLLGGGGMGQYLTYVLLIVSVSQYH